jgi:hypothetical protein
MHTQTSWDTEINILQVYLTYIFFQYFPLYQKNIFSFVFFLTIFIIAPWKNIVHNFCNICFIPLLYFILLFWRFWSDWVENFTAGLFYTFSVFLIEIFLLFMIILNSRYQCWYIFHIWLIHISKHRPCLGLGEFWHSRFLTKFGFWKSTLHTGQ